MDGLPRCLGKNLIILWPTMPCRLRILGSFGMNIGRETISLSSYGWEMLRRRLNDGFGKIHRYEFQQATLWDTKWEFVPAISGCTLEDFYTQWCQNTHAWVAERVGDAFDWAGPQRGIVPEMVRATHTAPQGTSQAATTRDGRRLREALGRLRRLLRLPARPAR